MAARRMLPGYAGRALRLMEQRNSSWSGKADAILSRSEFCAEYRNPYVGSASGSGLRRGMRAP